MRYKFAEILCQLAEKDQKNIFLTGDLGFNVFDKLKKKIKNRFINAGVAEHNMVTVAAGLAYTGFKPWIYSIAPFITIKVLEEIRNDICFPNFNVKIVGLGGGFDYGIAGPTHHVLQDIAVILSLPNIKIYAPSFVTDMESVMRKMSEEKNPSYLRLTKAKENLLPVPEYNPTRRIIKGDKLTVITLGSIINKVIKAIMLLKQKDFADLWSISELPLQITPDLIESIQKTKKVCVVEEHGETGGLGQIICKYLIENKLYVNDFQHLFAKGYISKKYGDRDFYLRENGLDEVSIYKRIQRLVKIPIWQT